VENQEKRRKSTQHQERWGKNKVITGKKTKIERKGETLLPEGGTLTPTPQSRGPGGKILQQTSITLLTPLKRIFGCNLKKVECEKRNKGEKVRFATLF